MKVSIVMGSISDIEIGKATMEALEKFNIEYEVRVLSAHRTPALVTEYVEDAENRGVKVFIGIAGKAAHLAGVIAGLTTLPVIGVPVKSSTMNGLDSLLSVVQMPTGVPVATMAIDGGKNAGILAAQILAVHNDQIRKSLQAYKNEMVEEVMEMDNELKN